MPMGEREAGGMGAERGREGGTRDKGNINLLKLFLYFRVSIIQ